MIDHGNGQLSAVGFFNPGMGQAPVGEFFGGGVSSARMPAAFDIDGEKVVHCALVFGRALVSCEDQEPDALADGADPQGIIYAKVAHDGSGSSELVLSVESSTGDDLPQDDLEASYRLLYRAEGDPARWVDYRYTPALFAMN